MKTTTLLILAGILLAGKLTTHGQTDYSVTLAPTNTVADGTSGEEVYVRWEAPVGTYTLADFINFYRILTNGGQELIWFKQITGRLGDSQYVFTSPGEYKVSYMHFSFFRYYEKASARISVFPTTSRVTNALNYPPRSGPIIAFGDSLTEGVGSTQSNLVDWLEAYTGYDIINAGISGDTTGDALLRITNSVLAHNPSIVLILLCGNDILQGLPVSQTFSNLHTIVSLVQSNGAVALVVGIYNGFLEDSYREEFHELYTSTRSVFVPDIFSGILENPFTTIGGTHPNDEGYRRMALRIAPVLAEIIGPKPKLAIRREESGVAIEWFANTNRVYELLFSREVNAPMNSWNIIRTVEGANDRVTISVTTENSQGFFVVRRR